MRLSVLRSLKLLILGIAALSSSLGTAAAVSDNWQALTAADVEAAHRLLLEDHPATSAQVDDRAFVERTAAAYSLARVRAAKVNSYDGYMATLAGFAVSLGDKHIWSRPLYTAANVEWAGILIGRRPNSWFVAHDERGAGGKPLAGATLLSCDGVPADRFAEQRLGGFKMYWPIEAQRIQQAHWLLVDDGNPFLKRPERCEFADEKGVRRLETLQWQQLPRMELNSRVKELGTRGAAGFGVRRVGAGYWIGLQSLSQKAEPVVAEVRARAAALRDAPYVVLDLRGNGGGNSLFGRLIADELFGKARVQATLGGGTPGDSCSKVWRTSDRNLAQLQYYRDVMGPQQGPQAVQFFTQEHALVADAKAAGQPFSGPIRCGASASSADPPETIPAATPAKPRQILLTDNSCFSSCLIVVDEFRRLGALHVGQTTDANTHYMEVREERLPSGLSVFSTLQAFHPALPAQMGPFVPHLVYEGAIADTPALEEWVSQQVSSGDQGGN